MELNREGVKIPQTKRAKAAKELKTPEDLLEALGENNMALATFEGFNPSHRNDYVEWITEAKREATRVQRIATAMECGWPRVSRETGSI